MAVVLTWNEEKTILSELIESATYEGSGSSRLVYIFDGEISEDLKAIFDRLGVDAEDCVVKVALTHAGLNQSELEVNTWLAHADAKFLAPIYAYGQLITIMKRVDVLSDDDVEFLYDMNDYNSVEEYLEDGGSEASYGNWEDLVGVNPKLASDRFIEAQYELDNILGSTTDNEQVGVYFEDGQLYIVAYDYGFNPDVENCTGFYTSSHTYAIADDEELLSYIITRIVSLADGTEDKEMLTQFLESAYSDYYAEAEAGENPYEEEN